jgi:hypothetical protein
MILTQKFKALESSDRKIKVLLKRWAVVPRPISSFTKEMYRISEER